MCSDVERCQEKQMEKFYTIARSNVVRTPSVGASNDNSYQEASFEEFDNQNSPLQAEKAKGLENKLQD